MNEGNYKQSLIYHNKAYNFYLKNKESINIEFLHREVYLNNIGNVYKHLGKYKDAISLFKRALKTRSIIIKKDSELYGLLVSNLGFCLLKAGNYKDANAKFNLAEKIFKSINNKEELALVLIQKAELYSKLNNKQKSFLLGKESLKLSREAKALKCELYVLEKLIDFDNERLKNIRDYINLRNKIEFIDEKSRNTFYNIQLETNQIAQAKEKAETQRNQILLAIGILLLISGFLFIMYRNRVMGQKYDLQKKHQKSSALIQELIVQNQAIEGEVRQKEQRRIAMEIHDGVLNQLASIRYKLFKLELDQDQATVNEALKNIQKIQEIEIELRNLTHDLHTQSAHESLLLLPVIEQLIQVHQEVYGIQIDFIKDPWDWEQLLPDVKIGFTKILQEALFNVIKHAKATHVTIHLKQTTTHIHLSIKDNGKGFDPALKSSGIGLQNIHLRAKQIQAEVTIKNGKTNGVELVITSEKQIK
jgi:signal transduction histidine kinase